MPAPGRLPATYPETRGALHRVAVHVLARRRAALAGRIGLRASPGGFATPAAGPDHEVLRISGGWLLRERTGPSASTTALPLAGSTLAEAAAFAEVDLGDDAFSAGHDTPAVGDPGERLAVDDDAAAVVAAWLALGWTVLDALVAVHAPAGQPSVVQLWPEHLDAAVDVDVGEGRRANLGASLGDGFHDAPYLYVGPWGDERPGEPAFWNAPFGAVLGYDDVVGVEDPPARALDFLRSGLARLTPGRTG